MAYEAQVYDQLLPRLAGRRAAFARGVSGRYDANDRPGAGVSRRCDALASGAAAQGRPDGGRAVDRPFPSLERDGGRAVVSASLRYRVLSRLDAACRPLHPPPARAFPWLPELCERCQRRLPALLPPATIIHGGYQADNILVHGGRNVPIDWESAALAAGEIDLASLTWGWDDDLVALCEQEYCLARWPDGTPDDFALRLTAARVFLHLRRLGEADEEEGSEERIVDVEELLPLAERLRDLER